MSNLHLTGTIPRPITLTISDTRALSCNSSSEARPAISTRERQLRIARAVYFCKIHNIAPTILRIAILSQMERKAVRQVNWKEIVDIYFSKLVMHPLMATPYTLYAVGKGGWKTIYYPSSFSFSKYQTYSGLLGYPLGSMSHYVQESSTLKASEPSGVMVMLTIQLLKELGLVHKLTSFKNATNIAGSVIRILWATTLRDGRIYHENPALRYLNHHDKDNRTIHKGENHKCDGLFYRDSKGGNPLHGSFKYHLSRRGETFIRELVRRYMELTLAETKLDVRPEDLLVKKSDVERLHTRDQVVLLSRCAGTKEGLLHIVNDISDTQDSRVYGLMTMLTSSGRTTLGYHQYDITACLQSIVFDILDAKAPYKATKRFPEHFNMVVDRKSFRNKIASEIGKDIAWVKKTLTKIDNGGSVHKDTLSKSETLMRYKDESRPFVDEYMEYADPDMLSTSRRHSKVYNIDNPFVKERIGIKYDEDGRKIFGKFFFTWTQTERYIRELMKSSFSGYSHDVHDAIATREAIDVEVINKTISDAGFKYTKVEL